MKTEYICADQPANFIFRLRQSGGPYILVCRQLAENRPEFVRAHRRRSRCGQERYPAAVLSSWPTSNLLLCRSCINER